MIFEVDSLQQYLFQPGSRRRHELINLSLNKTKCNCDITEQQLHENRERSQLNEQQWGEKDIHQFFLISYMSFMVMGLPKLVSLLLAKSVVQSGQVGSLLQSHTITHTN